MPYLVTALVILIIVCVVGFFTGCSSNVRNIGSGVQRMSPYFGSGINYPEPQNIGQYMYKGGGSNGMLYTCNAGYIDLGHLRESADRIKCVFDYVYPCVLQKQTLISFRIVEPAVYYVTVSYPANWDSMSIQEKQKHAKNSCIDLAEYVAHKSLIWHEVITWYGYSCVKLFPEKPSAFSWEDIYSDVLGCHLGAEALRIGEDYNTNMTSLISQELRKLNVQPAERARAATQKIRGSWFDGGPYPFIDMKKRNFDVGFDGSVEPWLVPGICANCTPVPCPAHDLAFVSRNGLSFNVELEPKNLQGQRAARIVSNGNRICPEKHYRAILEQIRREAIAEKGKNVDRPSL